MTKTPVPDNYDRFLRSLKERIRTAQVRAALAVNKELVLLYWQIGKDILERQEQEGWGAKVISKLAKDLKAEFPEMKGFSSRNINYMRAFADTYPDEQIVQQLVAQIPWGHNVRIWLWYSNGEILVAKGSQDINCPTYDYWVFNLLLAVTTI